jgi:transcriptional regulator with XRE-family HTH domain
MLLGAASGSKVSRYENFTRMPGVSAIFAYEVVFNQPIRELFAGRYQTVRVLVRARAKRLLKRLTVKTPSEQAVRFARKLELLRSIVEAKLAGSRRKDA